MRKFVESFEVNKYTGVRTGRHTGTKPNVLEVDRRHRAYSEADARLAWEQAQKAADREVLDELA